MQRMLLPGFALACIAFLSAYASAQNVNSQAAPDYRAAARQFFATVSANFEKWDFDKNGVLTVFEVSTDLLNPNIRGNEAAALAVVKLQERKVFRSEGRDIVLSLKDLNPFGDGEGELSPDGKKLVLSYLACKKKIIRENRALFGNGAPHLSGIHQGRSSDCFLLATIGAMVSSRPQEIVDMIIPQQDGSYIVRFPAAPPELVPAPTDGELAAYSDAAGDGIWLHVIERAFAQIRDRNGNQNLIEPMDSLAYKGGSSARTLRLMTGHKVKVYRFARSANLDLGSIIKHALNEGRLVDANAPHHSCAAIAYDPQTDMITIWNPWGTSRLYKTVGLKMDHGTFTMPLHELMQKFVSICVEENVPIEAAVPQR